jgi:hypothetical protein
MKTKCEFCHRLIETQRHHVAQGFRGTEEANVPELMLDLCDSCHLALHRLSGEDGRALGLVLVERAGRGRNLPMIWKLTNRSWPSEETVYLWARRMAIRS